MYDCLIADNDMPIQTTSYVCFLDMTRCTVTGNRGVSTGGIDNESSVTVRNSIIWGNTSPQIRELWFTTRSSIYWAARCFNSCVQGAADYQNPHMPDWDQYNISSDPLFFDPDNGDFRLRTSSPCIGTGEGGVDMGAIPYDASVSVVTTKPIQTTISTPFPNPFNPVTTIRFTLAESGPVSLQVYNPLGQLVRDLSANMTVGQHSIAWNGRDDRGRLLGSGVYLVKLQAGSVVKVRRMAMVR